MMLYYSKYMRAHGHLSVLPKRCSFASSVATAMDSNTCSGIYIMRCTPSDYIREDKVQNCVLRHVKHVLSRLPVPMALKRTSVTMAQTPNDFEHGMALQQ